MVADAPSDMAHDICPPLPQVIVFAASDEAARAASDPLRTTLWETHRLIVLLPSGAEPVKALHAFRCARFGLNPTLQPMCARAHLPHARARACARECVCVRVPACMCMRMRMCADREAVHRRTALGFAFPNRLPPLPCARDRAASLLLATPSAGHDFAVSILCV